MWYLRPVCWLRAIHYTLIHGELMLGHRSTEEDLNYTTDPPTATCDTCGIVLTFRDSDDDEL